MAYASQSQAIEDPMDDSQATQPQIEGFDIEQMRRRSDEIQKSFLRNKNTTTRVREALSRLGWSERLFETKVQLEEEKIGRKMDNLDVQSRFTEKVNKWKNEVEQLRSENQKLKLMQVSRKHREKEVEGVDRRNESSSRMHSRDEDHPRRENSKRKEKSRSSKFGMISDEDTSSKGGRPNPTTNELPLVVTLSSDDEDFTTIESKDDHDIQEVTVKKEKSDQGNDGFLSLAFNQHGPDLSASPDVSNDDDFINWAENIGTQSVGNFDDNEGESPEF